MSEDMNEKKTLWIYAVILFTSAFIVLLLTAYSQIKFNNNINEYKNQLSSETNEKNNFLINLNKSLEVNNKLSEEMKIAKENLDKTNIELEESKAQLEKLSDEYLKKITACEKIALAQKKYNDGSLLECADVISHLSLDDIKEGSILELYNDLKQKTYKKSAYQLYTQGYNDYYFKRYDPAIENFKKSLKYDTGEYFSDDSVYFLAYSYYNKGDYSEAAAYMERLIKEYPQSSYKSEAESLLYKLRK